MIFIEQTYNMKRGNIQRFLSQKLSIFVKLHLTRAKQFQISFSTSKRLIYRHQGQFIAYLS